MVQCAARRRRRRARGLSEYWESGQVPCPFSDCDVTHQVDLYLVIPRGLSYDEQGQVSYRFRAE